MLVSLMKFQKWKNYVIHFLKEGPILQIGKVLVNDPNARELRAQLWPELCFE